MPLASLNKHRIALIVLQIDLFFHKIIMIKIPTVLVLGAGASTPFGLPSRQILVGIICNLLMRGPSQAWIPSWHKEPLMKMSVILRSKFSNEAVESFAQKLSKLLNVAVGI
jgi:hypothetical protein